MKHYKTLLTVPLVLFAQAGTAADTEEAPAENQAAESELDAFQVIGSKEAVFNMPGSGTYLSNEELERFKFKNVNDLLLQVPGVYTRDEDGFGNFPNISIRGVDTNRSAKVTLTEDGILMAPAPYSAPSAYYSPTVGRMNSLEILKGSSQIEHGPHTTGGVINYVSTPIPESRESFVELAYGNEDTFTGHLWTGGKTETEAGAFGALFEIHHQQTDGFRDITPSVNGSFDGSDDTGFDKTDYMVKLSFEPNWQRRNAFELKLGYTNFDANESYLGLNPADFRNAPFDRYAASAADNIETEHFRTHLRHILEFDSESQLATTLYFNHFKRDWFKLDKVSEANTGASDNPARIMMTDPGILRGETRGDFKIKSNDREYYLYGIQSKFERSFHTNDWQHDLTLGARLHADKIDRFQDSEVFANTFAGDFGSPDDLLGPDTEGDREQETVALALFARDRISFGDWTFTPGIRWEYIDWDFVRRDNRTTPEKGEGNYSVVAPGLGFEYQLTASSKIFGGYHRGFSLPSPGSRNKGFDEEISDTFEFGLRHNNQNGIHAEAVVFYTELNDLVVEENISGGPGNEDGNIGDIDTFGFEGVVGADIGHFIETSYGIPVRLTFTYTDSTLADDTQSPDAGSIFAAGKEGNQAPYVPEYQLNLTTGLEFEKFRAYVTLSHVDERYADARNSSLREDTDGNSDARFGKLDSYTTVSLSAFYDLTEDIEIFARGSNIFEEEYISSKLPHGPRAGAARLFSLGANYRF
ncbi:MAG: TonB-dependent receptor family protein [Opitutales bacterium]